LSFISYHLISEERLYEVTRGNWVVGKRRRFRVKYAFSIYNGLVRQVYKIFEWSPISARSPEQKIQKRWRFDGEIAEELQHYIGGSVEKYLKKGAINPIKYINIY
jgi:hypothetical protein